MSETLNRIKSLAQSDEVVIFSHGYDELADDHFRVRDVVKGLLSAELIEDYPDFPKGPCVLVLEQDEQGNMFHAVWGLAKGSTSPAVLITAYRPDPERWSDDFRSRIP